MNKTYNTNKEMNYYDLIGLEEDVKAGIKSILANVKYQASNVSKKRNWHAFAFIGEHGTCKKTTARSIAHELFKLNAITKDYMEIIRVADLDIEKKRLNERLDSFEGLLYIRDSQSLEQRFSFSTGIDTLLDYLELQNPPIAVVIEFRTRHSFNKVMNQNARFCEMMDDSINRSLDFNYRYTPEQAVEVLRAMANHSKQIEEIGFVHPIVLDYAFEREALKVFDGIVKEKGVIDGIAIKSFLRACIDQFVCARTQFSEKTKLYLEDLNDIPEKYRHYLIEPAKIPQKDLCFLPYHPALTKQEKIEELKQCIVFIEAYRTNSSIPIQSTGTIITSSGYVLVCSHCVAGYDRFRCRVYAPGPGAVSAGYRWFEASRLCNTEIAAEYDQAILKMDGDNFNCVSLMSEDEHISAGEELTIIGYPMGDSLSDRVNKLHPSVMPAWLASVQEKHGIQMHYLGGINGYGGMSGAPAFNEKGKLVCIVQGEEYDSSNLHQNGMMFATAPNLDAITEKQELSYTLDISTDVLPF